jgi:hypothetical protein
MKKLTGRSRPHRGVAALRLPKSRFLVPLVVFGALVVASLGPGAGVANACEENGVFWSMRDGTGARATAWGADNDITLNSQTLKCVTAGGDAGTGHTSRILLGGNAGNWVEAGHMNKICSGGGACQRAFWEYNVAGTPGHQDQFSFGCLNPGTRHTWEVIRESAGGTYSGWLACYTTTWNYLGTSPNLGYNSGFAEGEGFERGNVGDGWTYEGPMQETHSNMKWYGAFWAGPNNANGLLCRSDDSYRWDGSQTSLTSMTFVEVHRGVGC